MCQTDTALAARMDISRAYLSAWRSGKELMPASRVVQAAGLARMDPGPWLLLVHEEQACGATQRAWQTLRIACAG